MSRWRALTLLALAMVLSMSTWFSASAVLPALRERWSLSSVEGSLLTIAVQVGFVAGALISSVTNLSDIVPARRVFFVATLGAAAANALVAFADGAPAALAARFATGFFVAGIYPPAMKVMATHFRTGRGLALGVMIGALTVGSAMPHLVNGLGGLDWRAVVLATSVMTVAGGIVALLFVADGPHRFPPAVFQPRFSLTVATIWLVPVLRDAFGWWAAFAALAPGPFLGAVAMLALKGRPEARLIAGGRG